MIIRRSPRKPDGADAGIAKRNAGSPCATFSVCAITYLSHPQSLPPFYNAALSMAQAGLRVRAFGAAGPGGSARSAEVAPGFTFARLRVHTRALLLRIEEIIGENIVTAALQYLLSSAEYTIRTFLRARRCRTNLVEAHDLPSLLCAQLIAKARGRPLVYHAHELWAELGPGTRFSRLSRWLEKRLLRGVDLVVVPEANRARIYREDYGVSELPLVIANCPPFRNASEGTKLRQAASEKGIPNRRIVLYQGALTRDRCIDEIVASTEYLDPDVSVAIMGNGLDDWSDPPSRIPPGQRVLWLPHVSYETLFEYTGSADIGIVLYRNTCRNNLFCAPNKLYEYMMMGLPVITCDFPGLVSFVEGQGIGLCVDPEDPRAIAGAMNRIASNDALRHRMRENCLRLAKARWNWEHESARLYDAYARICPEFPIRTAPSISE